jgi:hypothetical protein
MVSSPDSCSHDNWPGRLGSFSPPLRGVPIVDVLAHLILGQTVALLDLAFELIPAAVDHI